MCTCLSGLVSVPVFMMVTTEQQHSGRDFLDQSRMVSPKSHDDDARQNETVLPLLLTSSLHFVVIFVVNLCSSQGSLLFYMAMLISPPYPLLHRTNEGTNALPARLLGRIKTARCAKKAVVAEPLQNHFCSQVHEFTLRRMVRFLIGKQRL